MAQGADGWVCPKCNLWWHNGIGFCTCGAVKPESERMDVMGWVHSGKWRYDVQALGNGAFTLHIDGEDWGTFTLNQERGQMQQGERYTYPLTPERMAMLTLLDARVTAAQAQEVR